MKKKLFVTVCNHFDLAWRRCFKRNIYDKERIFISYSALQKYYITDCMELCDKYDVFKFNIESVAVIREFLESCPEQKGRLLRLIKDGRCGVQLSGDNIIDSNLCSGETLIRNFTYGRRYLQRELGIEPVVAVRNDAFGNSAQLPQILLGCGVSWMTGAAYSTPEGEYFKGVDGSTVYVGNLPVVCGGGTWHKYPPCGKCLGEGKIKSGELCPVCGGRGIDSAAHRTSGSAPDPAMFGDYEAGIAMFNSEERLTDGGIIEWAESLQDDYDVEFALVDTPYELIKPMLTENVGRKINADPRCELNPNNTGCYSSRILTKQYLYENEYSMLRLETLALMLGKTDIYTPDVAEELWRTVLYGANHDIVTGEHVDAAFEEYSDMVFEFRNKRKKLLEAMTGAEAGIISVVNTSSQTVSGIAYIRCGENETLLTPDGSEVPVYKAPDGRSAITVNKLAPFGVLELHIKNSRPAEHINATQIIKDTDEENDTGILQGDENIQSEKNITAENTVIIENQFYTVAAAESGIEYIIDKKTGRTVSKAGAYRPGQYTIEHDEGSPWTTLSSDREEGQMLTFMTGVERCEAYERICFVSRATQLGTYTIDGCEIKHSVTLYSGLDQIEFDSEIFWDTYSHRIRARFPVCGRSDGGYYYGVPCATLKRQPYKPVYRKWAGSDGDWPACGWGGVETDITSAAVFNAGTPSYRIESQPGNMDQLISVTLLRSPCIPTYLHEPRSYSMTAYDGMRDTGNHSFKLVFTSRPGSFAWNGIPAEAEAFKRGFEVINAPVKTVNMPQISCRNLCVTAIKPADDGMGYVIRFCDLTGLGGTAQITGVNGRAYLTDLNEAMTDELFSQNGKIKVNAGKHKIVTVKII